MWTSEISFRFWGGKRKVPRLRRLTPRKNVPEQRKNVLIQRRMFQLREDSFDSKEECSSPKDACSDQKKECSNPEKNVPEHSSLGWNLHPWVRTFFLLAGTFFLGVRTFFSELEPSSLDQNILPLFWNIPSLSQNILPFGWNILPWSQNIPLWVGTFLFFLRTSYWFHLCVVLGHSWFSFRYADVSGRAIF